MKETQGVFCLDEASWKKFKMNDGNLGHAELAAFRTYLDRFVFFHLGSDAEVNVSAGDREISVRIAHSRVADLKFRLAAHELAALISSGGCEDYLLELLTRHRRTL